jgi:pimeloyl-ACP methyl ester carboxylesterase
VGASFGGLLAQRFALRYPGRVTHLVLADTSVPRPARAAKNRRAARIIAILPSRLVRWLLRGLGGKAMKGVDPTGFWTHYTAEVVAGLGAEDLAAHYRAAADLDAGPVLDGRPLASRTLLLESDDDPFVRKAAAQALREAFPGANLHVFRGGGHAPSILRPDEYAHVIASFLARP